VTRTQTHAIMIAKMERFFAGSVNLTSAILLVVVLSNFALFGQTSSPSAVNKTFLVRGMITDPSGAIIPKSKIAFRSKQISRAVYADAKGSYEIDLPYGGDITVYTWLLALSKTTISCDIANDSCSECHAADD
jgi:hypothetical protein